MDKIYELKDRSKLIVYSYQNSIFTYSLPARVNSSPMSIADDYDSMLESCIFDSTVYYVYKNTSQNIVMANLLFHNPHVIFNDEAKMYIPAVCGIFQLSPDLLCIIAVLKNPVNQNYTLEIWETRPDFKRMTLPTSFSSPPEVKVVESGDEIFIFEHGGTIHQVLQINRQCLQNLFETSKEEVIDRPDIYNALSARYLPGTFAASACPNCARNEEKIKSITRQYNELVETTKQIQAEGLQWKNRYQNAARKNTSAKKGKA